MTTPTSDRDLLLEVVRARSADAFSAIVERYLGLVHAAARRQVGEALADDVTQAVFLLLWQRASRVRDGAVLAGWLVNATRLTAIQALRAEARRQRREQQAAADQILSNNNHFAGGSVKNERDELTPLLDDALGRLGVTERTAVTLRYLQDKSLAEVATTLGVSEAAAAKRVSRGIGRLRRELAKRGLSMPSASVGPAMLTVAQRGTISSASLNAAHVVANATACGEAGAMLAKAVATGMALSQATTTAVVTACLAAIVAVGLFAFKFTSQRAVTPNAQSSIQPTATPTAGAPPASGPLPPIKVGLVVSNATAVAQSPMGHPWGFQVQTRMAKELHAPDVELYAVVEPGTADADGMQEQLQQVFGGRAPIDGGDADAIKQLNVVVTNENWVTTPELLKGLDAAVSDGVGLVNNGGIGSVKPGVNTDDPTVTRLAGVKEIWFGQSQSAVACEVMSDHPLLGGLRDQAQVMLRIDGVYGVMPDGAEPLIKVVDMSKLGTYGKNTDDAQLCTFYPVYLSKLGKGRIVSVQYAPWHRATVPPPQLGPRSNFFLRCVRWLVDRPVG